MPLKVIQHMFTSTMERLVAEGDLSVDTRTALIRYSHSHTPNVKMAARLIFFCLNLNKAN